MKRTKHLTKRELKKRKTADQLYNLITREASPEEAEAIFNSLTDDGVVEILKRLIAEQVEIINSCSDVSEQRMRADRLNSYLEELGLPILTLEE